MVVQEKSFLFTLSCGFILLEVMPLSDIWTYGLYLRCAMALVHQRIRRIFYAFPNPEAGALGSVHRLQGVKSLNHHYAVFRVVLPEEVEEEVIGRTKLK